MILIQSDKKSVVKFRKKKKIDEKWKRNIDMIGQCVYSKFEERNRLLITAHCNLTILHNKKMGRDKHSMDTEKITINDVAEALGVSKTTVSRAISGKGRIGAETRAKVLTYIEEHNYVPSAIAKGLVESKTYNIAFAIPADCKSIDISFFQKCMMSIADTAAQLNYDMIVTTLPASGETTSLERLIVNKKIDGVILGRTIENDPFIEYLQKKNIPFVTIGSTSIEGVVQLDHDHYAACMELTSLLLLKGISRLGLIGNSRRYIVNQKRYEGYIKAHENMGKKIDHDSIYMDITNRAGIERAVSDLLTKGIQCIVCMDDSICQQVLDKLIQDNYVIPDDIKVASFYDSALTDIAGILCNVTSIRFDAEQMGIRACKTLIDVIDKKPVIQKELLGYNITLKYSTQSN